MSKKILITGASGGFGKLTVEKLISKGHKVAAGMRDVNGRNKNTADALSALGAIIIELDVTNDESVTNGVAKAIENLGGLDVLMNNAGIGSAGMLEFFTTADFQKVYEVNVFGVQRMNRAVVPFFRNQKSGLIVYTSSLLGRIALPFYGLYQTSKWALEALAENYRAELSTFGIENCIVEPGGYPTAFAENLLFPSDTSQAANYGEFINAPQKMGESFGNVLANNPQQDPQRVADTFAELIDKPFGEKPFRTTVDFIGMGDHVDKYNEHLSQVTQGLYTNFGIVEMLSVKK
ncbi:SDR family oxidoreductase [Flavobacterium sp.]|uniref:SDR family oxidoreductase n=1 Tax=Flavobacterium sp. TaxID=239 RepID=UPI00286E4283|nr:SDR family oxidoreductase [Flavobacterium sp.]